MIDDASFDRQIMDEHRQDGNAKQTDLNLRLLNVSRIVCPASDMDRAGCLSISDGRIVSVDESNCVYGKSQALGADVLLPGLIDLHCHLGSDFSIYGVPPSMVLSSGVTMACSQGDAGARNVDRYVSEVITPSANGVKLAMNLSAVGESLETPCFHEASTIDVDACIKALGQYREHVWAVAVNVSHHACPTLDPRDVVKAAIKVAEETRLPILYGMRRPEDWPLAEQLALLRQGDVVTYCFRKSPHCIVEDERVIDCVVDARARGILFDVGHGCGSFDFAVAETAIRCGFLPDTISTDLQSRHIAQGTRHDLPLVMSKLHAVGMEEIDIYKSVTMTPSRILGESERGTLVAGAIADLTLLNESCAEVVLEDTSGNSRRGKVWTATQVFVEGESRL